MSKIYILSTYDEYGAENVKATTNKDNVMMLAELVISESDIRELNLNEKARLGVILRLDDLTSKDGENISEGWGGLMIHIVEDSK